MCGGRGCRPARKDNETTVQHIGSRKIPFDCAVVAVLDYVILKHSMTIAISSILHSLSPPPALRRSAGGGPKILRLRMIEKRKIFEF
jgi:hypothetical protein